MTMPWRGREIGQERERERERLIHVWIIIKSDVIETGDLERFIFGIETFSFLVAKLLFFSLSLVGAKALRRLCAINNSNNSSSDVKQRNYNNRIFVCHAGVIRNNATSVFATHVCVYVCVL